MTPHLWVSGGQLCNQTGRCFPATPWPYLAPTTVRTWPWPRLWLRHGLGPIKSKRVAAASRVPHRLERIRELGASPITTQKATNYDASLVALQSLERPLVVLAGGRAKRGEPGAWQGALRHKAAAVVLFGEARSTFCELLGSAGYSGVIEQQEHLDPALPARQLANSSTAKQAAHQPAPARPIPRFRGQG